MRLISIMRTWWRATMYHERVRDEVNEEISFHLDARAADLERSGLAADDARRQARIEMGLPERQGERYREAIGLRWLDELGGDLRYAWRILWRSKGFTAVAVGSLALGIGANTIIFSLAKGVLLDRLAVPQPEGLKKVTLFMGPNSPVHRFWGDWFDDADKPMEAVLLSYPVYDMLRQQNHESPVLRELFAFKDMEHRRLTATVNGQAEMVHAEMVSGNFYRELGVRPELGRAIEPADDGAPGTGNVVTISDAMWTRDYGRSPDAIGKVMELNLIPMTIVGVNPPGFTGASSVQIGPDVFFPLSMQPVMMPMGEEKGHPSILDDKSLWWVQAMARVRPDVPLRTAQATVQTWMDRDIRATTEIAKTDVMPVVELADGSRGIAEANHEYTGDVRVLSALTGLVLLLACTNLANLLLARSTSRQREMAVRMALGARRGRVLRQVLTESFLLSFLGGAGGLLLGYMGRNVIPHLYTGAWEMSSVRSHFDWTILGFAGVVSLLTGLLFGTAPAWQAMWVPVNAGLKDTAATATRRRTGLAGSGLVVAQVALSMMLLICAGLFGGTLRNLYREHLGFEAKNVLLFQISAPQSRYPAPKDVQLHERLEERLRRVPGVDGVTLSFMPLVADGADSEDFLPTEQSGLKEHKAGVMENHVGRSFFETLQMPIRMGRSFRSSDTSTSMPVAVINQTLANKVYGNANPIGATFKFDDEKLGTMEIVGVVADAKYDRLSDKPKPTVYTLYDQMPQATQMTYELKTPLRPEEALPRIRAAVAEVDKDLAISDVRTQQAQINASIADQRTFAVLTAAFGALALILACIGIYGLMAYDVARRTSEIGIRMALGAQARQMMTMVLRETTWMAVAGVGIGMAAALWLAKFVKSMLYGLAPNDPWVLGGAAGILLLVALAAGFGPARRAAHVEPMIALRHE